MADSVRSSNHHSHRRISPSTTSSSTGSPSVTGQTNPRIRIRLTQNANSQHDHTDSTPNHSALTSATQSPRSALARAEPSVPGTMQQNGGSTDAFHDRMSESLSPAPARSPSLSPNRMGHHRSAGGTSHARTPSGTSSHNLSPSKPVRRKRQEPTFICSRDFAPLPAETQLEPHSEAYNSNKRTELSRFKSKTDSSHGAMTGNGGVDGSVAGLDNPPTPSLHPLRKLQTIEGNLPRLPLNTSSVQDENVPSIPTHHCTPRPIPKRQRERLFGLEEAPTFYPTAEEFADPLAYIEKIGDPKGGNGKKYGIVKIVPPEGWNPEFVLNQDQFRFRTRMQRLNSLSADARASLNYLEQLQKFHAQQGHARVSIPVVDRRAVDLYNLRLIVTKMGGHEAIGRSRNWANVTRKLGYEEKDAGHLAAQIKAAYLRIILPFEKFLIANREKSAEAHRGGRRASQSPEQRYSNNASMSPSSSVGAVQAQTAPAHQSMLDAEAMEVDRSLDDVDSNKRRSTRKRYDPAKSSALSLLGKDTTSESGKKKYIVVPGAEEQMCEICLRGDSGTAMLLCDDCNRGYHMFCLNPPLTVVPKSSWYCPPCLVGTGNDYGFEDGDTHSLSSFWKRAEGFRSAWWSKHAAHIWKPDDRRSTNGFTRPVAGAGLHVSEDDVEREFWRLVHSPDDNVEVEYGADVHSTTHGSALPTLETFPLSVYARDGWNLNNLPILPDSLLRFIKSDISGMTVPWLYVGMIFSTFCWHIEDHHTYSINYHHFGDTKTWYGVPGSDALLLEQALKTAAPDLFEQSPDLLDQLVTMMSPDKLKKHGVHVYACDQRANEFVITYPRAYHSGFNHGFNINEAVNFALPDWINAGLDSVKRYKQSHRSPVFSHDELLMTVYQHSQSVETALWLQHSMDEMVKREIEQRNALRRLVPTIVEIVDGEESDEAEEKPEQQYQCAHCKAFCYLGQITSDKAQGVACLDHGNEVCGVDSPTKWTLRLRYSDEALTSILAKTIERAAIPSMWKTKLTRTICSSPNPSLRNLRGLLNDGEKLSAETEAVNDLKVFVKKANGWVEEANTFIARKHQKRSGAAREQPAAAPASRRGKRASKVMEEEEEVEEELGDPARVYSLLGEVDLLSFDAPEIGALRGVAGAMEGFNERAAAIFKQVDNGHKPKLLECEEVLSMGQSLSVKLPLLEPLQRYVGKQKWIKEVEAIQDSFTNLEDVESFIQEGVELEVSLEDGLMKLLQDRLDAGLKWKSKAEAILGISTRSEGQTRFKMEETEEMLRASYKVAIDPDLHVKIEALLKHIRDWSRQCEVLVREAKSDDDMEAYKRYVEASRLLKHMADSTIVIKDEDKVRKMKATQDEMEARVWYKYLDGTDLKQRLVSGSDKWEPSMVLEVAAQIKTLYLEPIKECLRHNTDGPCICHSNGSEKGAATKCSKCSISYHNQCLGLDKKEAKDKEWQCPFCDPRKLSKLVSRHKKKPELRVLRQDVEEGSEHQPWGMSPTYTQLRQLNKLASRLDNPKFPPKDQEDKRIDMLKQLIHCPLRIVASLPPKDPLMPLVTWMYIKHGLDENGSEAVVREKPAPPLSSIYKVPVIPPFRSASRETGTTTPAAAVSAPSPSPVPTPSVAATPAPASHHEDGPAPYEGRGDESQADVTMNTTMDFSDGEEAADQGTSKKGRSGTTSDERKRKRGKRAKFVFEEEVGIFVPVQGERIYCLCHRPETGTMISCERCSLWFHNTCVHITSEADLGDERWICPMCCVKTERKYPHAEVKVKAMGEIDPNLWIDVRATLRSTRGPVTKMQHWGAEPHKRIALHLESFYPATLPTTQEPPTKRSKNHDGSPGPRHARGDSNSSQGDSLPHHPMALGSIARNPNWNDVKARVTPAHRTPLAEERAAMALLEAQERHKAGMANLYSRGVNDAMIQRWFVGWNGHNLVYPRKDHYGNFIELSLGPYIKLAEDDPDGSKLIRGKLAEEAERHRREQQASTTGADKTHVEVERRRVSPPPAPGHSVAPPPHRGIGSSHSGGTVASHSAAQGSWRSRNGFESRPLPTFAQQPLRPLSPPPRVIPPHRNTSLAALVPPPLPSYTSRNAAAPSSGDNSPSHGHHRLEARAAFPSATSAVGNSAAAAASSSTHSPRAISRPLIHSPRPLLQSPRPSIQSPRPLQQSPRGPVHSLSLASAKSSSSSPSPSINARSPPLPQQPPPPRSGSIRTDTPEAKSSLDEYRMLARKMKPNATNEEIEMMARHAMS